MVFLTDAALTDRLLEHVAAGTTDVSEEVWREPVEHYLTPERLHAEVHGVLRRRFVAFCPSAALPGAGSYLARTVAGVPLVATRGRDGAVRVFRNSCRHRGTAVASGTGCATSFVCPYHGWVYGSDGSLRHVPDVYGFPGLDRESRGLVGVRTAERAGLVFVAQDAPHAGEQDVAHLPDVVGADHTLRDHSESIVDANWKVLLEGFLEGYHIKATHRQTFFPFGYDNINVVETLGRHSRVTFPFRRIESLRELPPPQRHLEGMVTVVYHLFPNVIVAQLSHHTTVVVLEPETIDRTRMVTFQMANPSTSDAADRDAKFVQQGQAEDRDMALAVQRGLAGGANDVLEFGRFEGAIAHFHRQLTDLLQ
jgi:phenylpropionate dioxygenase-like ring-hydroxylating dioxygenase large terminal subunit